MKKLFCVLLALILCVGLLSCGDDESESLSVSESLSEESSEDTTDADIIQEEGSLRGKFTEKLSSNVLEMELVWVADIEKWGGLVHVVTDNVDEFCEGEYIEVEYSSIEVFRDESAVRFIATSVSAMALFDKPIIYLYPDSDTLCSVKVNIDGKLTCTYPEHGEDGWENFIAKPDGTLVFPDGREYYALYWEGAQNTTFDFSKGFCVRGEDTAQFLEWALAEQGLNEREANEFIIYWLPLMQENPYNVISFQTEAYTDTARLEINPNPDSLLRVFMAYYSSDTEVELAPQEFDGFERVGFTVVEWGGSQVKKP